jgi:uncharacterized protein (DUF1697 family)
METYIVLLRGINVGGKNRVPMLELRKCLEGLGYVDVVTYIASGNVLLKSKKKSNKVRVEIEKILPKKFKLDSELIKVLVLTRAELKTVVVRKPRGFGEAPKKYHCDAIFLMDLNVSQTMKAFSPKEGVDTIWPGKRVIYSQRLSSLRTKSRLNRVMVTPVYKHMTIRNWNTVTKLLTLMHQEV